MKATEFIAAALEGGRIWMEALLGDLDGADALVPATGAGGNHALWILGHLTVSEASILSSYIQGRSPAMPEWQPLFGQGSQPVADPGKYPSKTWLLTKHREVRAETLAYLKSITDADLENPSHAAHHTEMFGTVGRCLAILINHQMFHAGQLSDIRRTLGRKPVFG